MSDAAGSGAAFIVAAMGAPHALVNFAGIASGRRIVERNGPMALDKFERVIRVT